jgi:site-specific DNA recombinase
MTDIAPLSNVSSNGTARAVLYLRVSTKDQATRGGATEGFSIPAQRQACTRKAESIDAEVIEEFVDRGESAKTADRPELRRMLKHLATNPVDYVIVHKVDRLARNRADDVTINLGIQEAGATLVSCTENIDNTPSGALMHGIMSSIAEFYSRNLATEVVKGSTQKAMAGGTIGKAPTGYLNVRKIIDHREVRTVEIDPERGPLMEWVFEQYATGEWSIRRLLEAVTDKGLTSTGGPNTPSKPLSLSNFNRLLKNDYYTGTVSYRGAKYPGTHEPLIGDETFRKVQDVLAAHARSGEKQRRHSHYLKGTVACRDCGSRLIIVKTTNRHGTTYPYFVCIGRHEKRNDCTQKAILIDDVEAKVIEEHRKTSISATEKVRLEQFIHDALTDYLADSDEEQQRQSTRIIRLKAERSKLLQAHLADAVPLELLKEEQDRIERELQAARSHLAAADIAQNSVEEAVSRALALVENGGERYETGGPRTRRQMNQSVFDNIQVGPEDPPASNLTIEYQLILHDDVREAAKLGAKKFWRMQQENRRTLAFAGQGSSNDWLVGDGGLEPSTSAV